MHVLTLTQAHAIISAVEVGLPRVVVLRRGRPQLWSTAATRSTWSSAPPSRSASSPITSYDVVDVVSQLSPPASGPALGGEVASSRTLRLSLNVAQT